MDAFQRSIAQSLRQVADGGTRIYLMHGNRDFLIGKAFCREAGCTLLPDPSVIDLYGEPVLLMHGDSLCTRDEAYMRLRRWLRNPLTLWVLRHLPLATRHKLARKLRKESRAQTRMKAVDIIDVTPESAPGHAQAWRAYPDPRPHSSAGRTPAGHRRPARPAHRARRLGPPGLGPGDRRQRPSPGALPALTHPRPAMRAFQNIMRFAFFRRPS